MELLSRVGVVLGRCSGLRIGGRDDLRAQAVDTREAEPAARAVGLNKGLQRPARRPPYLADGILDIEPHGVGRPPIGRMEFERPGGNLARRRKPAVRFVQQFLHGSVGIVLPLFANPIVNGLIPRHPFGRAQVPQIDPIERKAQPVAFLPHQSPDLTVAQRNGFVPFTGQRIEHQIMRRRGITHRRTSATRK